MIRSDLEILKHELSLPPCPPHHFAYIYLGIVPLYMHSHYIKFHPLSNPITSVCSIESSTNGVENTESQNSWEESLLWNAPLTCARNVPLPRPLLLT